MSVPARPVAPHLALAAAGALPVLALLPTTLMVGGLAPLFCATVVVGFLGAPLGGLEWRHGEDRVDPVRTALAETVLALWTAGAAAALTLPFQGEAPSPYRWFALASAVGAAFAGVGMMRTRAGSVAIGVALVVALAVVAWPASTVDGTGGLVAAAPWTLLEPHFEGWATWGPAAISMGLLGGGAGTGVFSVFRRAPGEHRGPWAAAGMALALGLAFAFGRSITFAELLGGGGSSPALLAFGVTALALAGPIASRRPLLLVAMSAWLAGPAIGAVPFVLTVLAPGLSATLLLRLAWTATRSHRWVFATAAAALATTTVAGSWPDDPWAAAAVGALVVGIFWWVATPLTLATREVAR